MSPPHPTGTSRCHLPTPGVPPSCPSPPPLFTALGCGTEGDTGRRVSLGTSALCHSVLSGVTVPCPCPRPGAPPVSQLGATTSPHLWHNSCDHVLPMKHSLCPLAGWHLSPVCGTVPVWLTVSVSPCPYRAPTLSSCPHHGVPLGHEDAPAVLVSPSPGATSPCPLGHKERAMPLSSYPLGRQCHCPHIPWGTKSGQCHCPHVPWGTKSGQCHCPHVPWGSNATVPMSPGWAVPLSPCPLGHKQAAVPLSSCPLGQCHCPHVPWGTKSEQCHCPHVPWGSATVPTSPGAVPLSPRPLGHEERAVPLSPCPLGHEERAVPLSPCPLGQCHCPLGTPARGGCAGAR
ncbi:DNA replication complex GINS protein PSF2 isoform X2 [Vidua macroura]|uniref:DNA replication complex GINS protein PSF2 isoform X2 n=1 Tax=Vidua macroura TaxID=187451 RepID=UPI0023A7BD92|nr:DNA replication complex GINS protein PSF2 isoform X2 [Vidua macroura]